MSRGRETPLPSILATRLSPCQVISLSVALLLTLGAPPTLPEPSGRVQWRASRPSDPLLQLRWPRAFALADRLPGARCPYPEVFYDAASSVSTSISS